MSELLLKIESSKILAEDLRPSMMYIYDDRIVYEANIGVIGGQESVINYDQIAEVNQERGVMASTITIVNKGGAEDIKMEHIPNDQAEQAKNLIQDQARKWIEEHGTSSTPPNSATSGDL